MFNLTFQYPAWFLIFCALLGLGYAMLLYYRDNTFRERYPRLHYWLGLLRWLAVTLLSALLLSPLLKNIVTETKKPIVVLAQDQSESIAADLQGTTLDQYKQNWQTVKDALGENYEVHELAFGDKVREGVDFAFQDKVSNLSEVMRTVYDMYGGQNLGAVVLASDGVYNEGSNPTYTDAQLSAPVYTIALGDTTPKRDLLLKRVFHNKIAYLGDKFTVQVDVAATNCTGQQSVLNVSKVEDGQTRTLQTIPISITNNDFFNTREIQLDADKPGIAQYVFSIAALPGEATTLNNRKEIYIDILDARQKILLYGNGPHPDLSALRQCLEQNKNYQIDIAYASVPGTDFSKYDFVVLHNLPSAAADLNAALRVLNERRTPRLFIAGMQTNYNALNQAQGLVTSQSNAQQSDDVQGVLVPQFASFSIDPRIAEELPRFNPLVSAFGNFGATPQAQVLMKKRIGKINTEIPLLALGEVNGIRTGILLGEGIWKWRLFDYMQHQNHAIFDELFGKTIQYLSLKEDKRKFRVTLDKSIFNENEPILFAAELYNDNYELTNDPDVSMSVRNGEGKEFTYTFNKIGKAYTLNAGILPIGNYTYRATTVFNSQQQVFEGKFSVRPIQLELFETQANHAVLRQLSNRFGGSTISGANLTAVSELIKANQTVKPVIYSTNKTNPLINLKWIFALLAGLLAAEWFMRRYFGAY